MSFGLKLICLAHYRYLKIITTVYKYNTITMIHYNAIFTVCDLMNFVFHTFFTSSEILKM